MSKTGKDFIEVANSFISWMLTRKLAVTSGLYPKLARIEFASYLRSQTSVCEEWLSQEDLMRTWQKSESSQHDSRGFDGGTITIIFWAHEKSTHKKRCSSFLCWQSNWDREKAQRRDLWNSGVFLVDKNLVGTIWTGESDAISMIRQSTAMTWGPPPSSHPATARGEV